MEARTPAHMRFKGDSKDLSFRTCLLIALIMSVLRLVLAYAIPVAAELSEEVDSGLFVKLALSILDGDWLGVYDSSTLVKNSGYSLLLAFCGWSHIRYQLVIMGMQVVAAALFARAIRPLSSKRWTQLAVYLFLLYTPLFFTTAFFRRIYRDGSVIAPTLALFASYIAVYLRRGERTALLVPWVVCAAISLGLLSVLKENSLWTMPFIGVCSLVILVGWAVSTHHKRLGISSLAARTLLLAAPLVASNVFSWAIGQVNQQAYGVSYTNERFQGGFYEACSEITLIDASGEDPSAVWVTREGLALAVQNSETLKSIEPGLEESWNRWATVFDGEQVYGDMAFWALRDAYANCGGYTDAVSTDEFWGKVASELKTAREEGRLATRKGIRTSSVSPPIPIDQLGSWLTLTAKNCFALLTYSSMDTHLVNTDWEMAEGTEQYAAEELRAREMLGGNTLLSSSEDDTASQTYIPNLVGKLLGHVGVWINRACALLVIPACIFVAIRWRSLGKTRLIEVTLIVLGLLLSALVFEAATTWYVCYQIPIFGWDRFYLEAYKYSSEFYTLAMMAECVLLPVVVECAGALHNRR